MKIYSDTDLSPNLQKFLHVMNENVLFYKSYNMKHPSALYNSSLTKIDTALKDFFEIYKRYNENDFEAVEKENTSVLIKRYEDLLYCFREHFDDCIHIVKSFIIPPVKEKADRNQYSWLEKNANLLVGDFFSNINEYKKYIDNTVNELKHNNASLCCVGFYNSKGGNEHCLGYFVANVVNGAFEPIEKVHAKFGTAYTAFSYRRDLTYNLFNIYLLSEEIIKLLNEKIGIDFSLIKTNTVHASDIKKTMYVDLMDMPRIYFPDEYAKPVPSISITEDNKLKLEYPSMLTIKPNRLDRVVVNHSGDGHTKEFKIPYM